MSLTLHYKHLFSPQVRAQGETSFKDGQVHFKKLSENVAEFEIKEKSQFIPTIHFQKSSTEMKFSCDCPHYFEHKENCKHIWGALLVSEQMNLFSWLAQNPGSEAIDPTAKLDRIDAPIENRSLWKELYQQSAQRVQRRPSSQTALLRARSTQARIGIYAIDLEKTEKKGAIFLHLFIQERLKDGSLGAIKAADLNQSQIEFYENPLEQELLWMILGKSEPQPRLSSMASPRTDSVLLSSGFASEVLEKLSFFGSLKLLKNKNYYGFSNYDRPELQDYTYKKDPYHFNLKLDQTEVGFQLRSLLDHGSIQDSLLVIENFVFFKDHVARADLFHHLAWHETLKNRPLGLSEDDVGGFLEFLWGSQNPPPITLPDAIQFSEIESAPPRVKLSFETEKASGLLSARLYFIYETQGEPLQVAASTGDFIYNFKERTKLRRLLSFENQELTRLGELNLRASENPEIQGEVDLPHFVAAVEKAVSFGWEVVALKKKLRPGKSMQLQVKSGVNWFDVTGTFQFDGVSVAMPDLLQAIKSGQRIIPLSDGTSGVLPEEWIKKIKPIAEMGLNQDDGLRLNKVQALFLSSQISEDETVLDDKKFKSLKSVVQDLKEMRISEKPSDFKGDLRSYQLEGLSWLKTLSENNLGGILADDMGLGKTIQVLSLLSEKHEKRGPTLVVAPKSLIFNWENETKKFAPHLKTLSYAGPNREKNLKKLLAVDLVLTTYPVIRSDIEKLKELDFGILILDEAHYAKNASSQTAMACKLLKAEKKIALTGTPIENSISDLFSILGIISPGLVSDSKAQHWAREKDPLVLESLGKALSPFILRRTKEQVLKELPEKSEQVLYVELSPNERRKYDELKNYYWGQLNQKMDAKGGLNRSKIEILEAILRLRQAACHQGLLDKKLLSQTSTKFELVHEQLESVLSEGHKALIFSQFTTLLGLFKKELTAKGIPFEYLDGQTENREERVKNFQNNPNIQLFLLSLKAGGVGLNLTAADYVFILDPWWNPAAEAQAIDRTHRIGQTKKVFAYKVIAKNTIEEKILDLQSAKRALARTIVPDETSFLKSLKMEDLQTLFE